MAIFKDKYFKKPLALVTALSLGLLSCNLFAAVEVSVNADNEKWLISDKLVGMHHIYYSDADAAYDGSIAAWASQVGIGTSRYPGGSVVKYWDWENPSGVATGDPWDPQWDPILNEAASQWMSLDEYISFVNASGISGMFGVNSLSGHKFNRQQDSIDRAVRMVKYVLGQGQGGAIWYIGNEEEFQHGSMAEYAKTFKAHAEAMKAADPNILIFWNNNKANINQITEFLANDGGSADGLETHGKWPYGGKPGLPPGTFDEWTVEVPLLDRKNNARAWRDAANSYRSTAKSLGRPGLLISNNEYGLGKGSNYEGFDQYSKGLLLTDMLQEFVLGNWFTTAFWSNIRPTGAEDALINHGKNYRMNPFHLGMGLLANAQGTMMVQSSSDHLQVYGFTSKTVDEVTVYLLNKSLEAQPVNIAVAGVDLDYASAPVATTMVDTEDKWGEYVSTAITYVEATNNFTGTLPALSYTQIKIPRVVSALPSPDAVTNLCVSADTDQVQLTWSHGGLNEFSEYRIYRQINPNAPFELLTSSLTTTIYTDTDVVVDIPYTYRVVAVDTADHESVAMEISAIPSSTSIPEPCPPNSDSDSSNSPDPVTNLSVSEDTDQVQLTWSHAGLNEFSEYRIYRQINPNVPFELLTSNLTATTYTDTDVVVDILYTYRVVVVDTADHESVAMEISATLGSTSIPDPVTNLSVSADTDQVQLTWSHAGLNEFSEYRIYRQINPNVPFELLTSNLTATTYTDTDVVVDILYTYRVVAVDTADHESVAMEISATPGSTPIPVPTPIPDPTPDSSGNDSSGGSFSIFLFGLAGVACLRRRTKKIQKKQRERVI
ncbi:fibronectin type III domain-containing protein [Colwellia piezophila]|uniref:fibronectin type III domain-containing protein n=1 Tax=Colwellia piezophila TaxID=211668 RepID=UPI0003731E69|nr:hypothetical protein [Colwellia piezophila]